jgi:hypothetical protein
MYKRSFMLFSWHTPGYMAQSRDFCGAGNTDRGK